MGFRVWAARNSAGVGHRGRFALGFLGTPIKSLGFLLGTEQLDDKVISKGSGGRLSCGQGSLLAQQKSFGPLPTFHAEVPMCWVAKIVVANSGTLDTRVCIVLGTTPQKIVFYRPTCEIVVDAVLCM